MAFLKVMGASTVSLMKRARDAEVNSYQSGARVPYV